MTRKGVAQAAEALRVYLTTVASPDRSAELSALVKLVNLIYQDRLNAVPLDQNDPKAAIEEVCQRFADPRTQARTADRPPAVDGRV